MAIVSKKLSAALPIVLLVCFLGTKGFAADTNKLICSNEYIQLQITIKGNDLYTLGLASKPRSDRFGRSDVPMTEIPEDFKCEISPEDRSLIDCESVSTDGRSRTRISTSTLKSYHDGEHVLNTMIYFSTSNKEAAESLKIHSANGAQFKDSEPNSKYLSGELWTLKLNCK